MAEHKTMDRTQVVVADDDPIIRQLFESKLTQMGCDVQSAEDGGAAWKLLRNNKHVDLAIVDLDMPNVDGFSLIQCVRGHPRTKHLPIIVVTSRTDAKAIQDAFGAGATSFLTKPLHWSTFSSHIEYLMRLTHAAHQARNLAQRAEAAVRIKDVVLRRTLEAGACGTERIHEILHRLASTIRSGGDVESAFGLIDELERETLLIQNSLVQGQSMSKALCSRVNVDDVRVPLMNLLANAQIRVQQRSREHNVPVSIVRVPEDAYIACDPEGLSLAVSHLLDNAVRYSPEGRTVTLEADVHPDGMLTIVINDDGPGMEPDFYAARLHPTDESEFQEQNCSEGVGLPLVKAIAEAHGGVLEIRSMPDHGTTAMLVVPADRVRLERDFAA
ncbi:MAG: response regulator [Alphaproteobacteria bacterium]|nr:response regulator [Alphaproteobacteria bacterium]